MKHEHGPADAIGWAMGVMAFIYIMPMSWIPSAWERQTDRRIEALEARPIVLPASLAPATVQPTSLTYEAWRASEPKLIATRDEAEVALVEAGMTPRAAASLSHLAATCEAPMRDKDGTSIGINLLAVGDGGLAHGPFQIHVGWNPQYADTYLPDLNESAKAAVEIWRAQGLSAWSCYR